MPSIRGRMMRWLIKQMAGKGTNFQKPISRQRQEMEERTARIKVPKGVKISPVTVGGISGEWIIPEMTTGDRTLMYIHGGGYYNGSLSTHRAFVARLAQTLKVRACHFAYRLAPEHPFPAGVDDCLTIYRWLLEMPVHPGSLLIAGESAGGALVVTTLLGARAHGLPQPAAAICISPHLDFTFSSPSVRDNAESEVLYTLEELEWTRGVYLGPQALDEKLWRHPMVSPLWADLAGLPPLLLHTTSAETLRDDAVIMAKRASDAGVRAELKVWEGLFHAFQLLSIIPESQKALLDIAQFVETCWKK